MESQKKSSSNKNQLSVSSSKESGTKLAISIKKPNLQIHAIEEEDDTLNLRDTTKGAPVGLYSQQSIETPNFQKASANIFSTKKVTPSLEGFGVSADQKNKIQPFDERVTIEEEFKEEDDEVKMKKNEISRHTKQFTLDTAIQDVHTNLSSNNQISPSQGSSPL